MRNLALQGQNKRSGARTISFNSNPGRQAGGGRHPAEGLDTGRFDVAVGHP
jgi:hypothetical protein